MLTAPEMPLGLDFGTSGSPVEAGYLAMPLSHYNSTRGYGWVSTSRLSAVDRGTTDPLTRDLHRGRDGTFLVDLAGGEYDVTVTLGDPSAVVDRVSVVMEGQAVAGGVAAPAGGSVTLTRCVKVTDGQLSMRLSDSGGVNGSFGIQALRVVPVVAPPTEVAPLESAPLLAAPTAETAPLESVPPPEVVPRTDALYVSTRGADTSGGGSPEAPLRSLAAALVRIGPGMILYIEGGTYYEPLVTSVAGTVDQPITITSYNGTAVIDGSTQGWSAGLDQNRGMVELRAPHYTLRGLKVVNSADTGIVLGASGLTVDGCEISGTQRHAISTDTRYQLGAGGIGAMIGDVSLTNNTVHHAVLKGLGYGQAISLIADGFAVRGNTIRDNLTEGIDIWLGSRHGEVVDNLVYGNLRCGIFVDGASYVRIERNKVYDNARDGIGISSEDPRYATHDVWAVNNLAHDNGLAGIFIWDDLKDPGFAGSQNVLVANNTLINNRTNIYLSGAGNTAEVANNLGYTTGSNLYNSATASTFAIHDNLWLGDLDGFVSASDEDFRLRPSSPAIDKGSDLPSLRDDLGGGYVISADILGLERVVNSRTDIGAYEFQ